MSEKMTRFQARALNYLNSEPGDRLCTVEWSNVERELREVWTHRELQRWEEEEGVEATGLPTWEHWRSYVFGE